MSKEGPVSLRVKLKQPTKEILFQCNIPLEYKLERTGEEVTINLFYPIIGPKRIFKIGLEEPEEDSV